MYNTHTGETSNAQRNTYASLSKAEVSSKTKEFSTGIKKKVIILTHYPSQRSYTFYTEHLHSLKLLHAARNACCTYPDGKKEEEQHWLPNERTGKVFSVKATTRPRYLSGESSSSVRRGESWLEKSILTGDPRCTMEEEFASGGEIRGGERAASPSLRPLGCLNEIQRAALSPSPVYCERLLIAPFVPLIYDESRVALVIRLAARCLVLNGRARSLQPSNNELVS